MEVTMVKKILNVAILVLFVAWVVFYFLQAEGIRIIPTITLIVLSLSAGVTICDLINSGKK